MHTDLSPVIAATAQWLTRAYPASGGALAEALCEVQARQAVTVAARLRYPSPMDVALLGVAGPGGSARLDRITGTDGVTPTDPDADAWRTWVDEVVASWAACLLTDPALAEGPSPRWPGAAPRPGHRRSSGACSRPTTPTAGRPPCCATRTSSRPSPPCTTPG